MVIYLEGPDGSGKTTLAKQLEEKYIEEGYKVFTNGESIISTHPTRPNRVNEKELYEKLYTMTKAKEIYILDRGPISDCIYRVFDDFKPVTNISSFYYFMITNIDNFIIIYCNNKNAEKNMLNRGDDNPVAINKHKELSKLYNLVMNIFDATSHYKEYDFAKDSIEDVTNIISEALPVLPVLSRNIDISKLKGGDN